MLVPIDLSRDGEGSVAEDRDALVSDIAAALDEAGGLVVTGFAGADRLAALAERMLSFFDLPDAVKRSVATRETERSSRHVYRGYVSLLSGGDFARSEMFDIGRQKPVPGPDMPGMDILCEQSQWPIPTPSPDWQQDMRDWYAIMRDMSKMLLGLIAAGKGFDPAELLALFRDDNSTLRLLNYPARPAAESPVARTETGDPLATDRHTDGSGLSLLWQGQPGLQAQGPDGRWHDIPAMASAVSIHLGDVLSMISGGRIPPTPHRVLDTGQHRRSIGFFLEPALSAPMRPLDQSGKAYPEDTYGGQLLTRLRSYPSVAPFIPGH